MLQKLGYGRGDKAQFGSRVQGSNIGQPLMQIASSGILDVGRFTAFSNVGY